MDDRILDKIKKCLALASSANEHEAAAALRQAQKLMEQHGVSDCDVLAAQAGESGNKAGAATKPAQWEADLAISVAEAFGCRVLFSQRNGGIWVFIGFGATHEVASYAFHVLNRQARKARTEYMATALKRVKRAAVKTVRADLFCEGWIRTALGAVTAWTAAPEHEAAVEAFLSVKYPSLQKLKTADRRPKGGLRDHQFNDLARGVAAGRSAVLNRGVGASPDPLALEG
jgi:hypothetical protein